MKTPKAFLFRKRIDFLINTTLLQSDCHLVLIMYLNIKYEIVTFEKCQIQPHVTSPLLFISNLTVRKALEILKTVNILISKGSRRTYKVKSAFTDNPSQNTLIVVYQIKRTGTFLKSFISDFVQFCCTISCT